MAGLAGLNEATTQNLGYFGNSERNYLTDRLVARAANLLKLTPHELWLWGRSKHGRWALDHECSTSKEFVAYMTGVYDIEKLKDEGWETDLDEAVAEYDEKYGRGSAVKDCFAV